MKDEAARTQGPLLLSLAFSPSLATMPHDSIWLTLCLNFCWSSKQEYFFNPDFIVEGYGKYPRGPEAAGVENIMSNDTFLSYTLH